MNLREHLSFPDGLTVTVKVSELRRLFEDFDQLHDAAEDYVRSCEMHGPMADPSKGSFARLRAAIAAHFQKNG